MVKSKNTKVKAAKTVKVKPEPKTPVGVRVLTEVEKQWIQEHYIKDKLTLDELAKKLSGVDLNEIAAFIKTVYQPPTPNQPAQERQAQLAGMPPAGQFMGRDPARGVAVMTEAASEISDARKVVAVPSNNELARKQPDRIKIIDPNKRVR